MRAPLTPEQMRRLEDIVRRKATLMAAGKWTIEPPDLAGLALAALDEGASTEDVIDAVERHLARLEAIATSRN